MSTLAMTTHSPSATAAKHSQSGWALAGLVAGLGGVASIGASMQIDAVYREGTAGDPNAVVAALSEQIPQILLFHTATLITVIALVIFGAGIQRRLRAQAPANSLLPQVAACGLWLVSVAGLLGSGLTTEFVFGVAAETRDQLVPEAAVFFAHWIGTIPWLWVGAGLAGVTIAIAALRHAAAPRWLGWTSLILGGLTLLVGMSPLQYLAGFVGPIWLTVVAAGFLAADRA
jgi:hypothetical protein